MSVEGLRIRAAEPGDVGLLLELIGELAEYERLSREAVGTEQLLAEHLFGERPAAEAAIAELAGEPVGFALFFTTFSTFLARPGIWVEDLFVRPEHRGGGIGAALLAYVARLASERGCGRLEWAALDWNESAHRFYRGVGARHLKEWQTYRLEGEPLANLARPGQDSNLG